MVCSVGKYGKSQDILLGIRNIVSCLLGNYLHLCVSFSDNEIGIWVGCALLLPTTLYKSNKMSSVA